jgi:hypothetical protein
MKICYCKVFVAFLLNSMVLIACNPAQTGHVTPLTETSAATPSPTTLPYWDLLPLDWAPDGGWTTLMLEEYDISFQIPVVYQTGECGKLVTFAKDVANYKADVIGFESSQIQLHIYSRWEADWEKLAIEGQAPPRMSLVTPVERFTLGGTPAVRYISTNPDSKMLLYSKGTWAYYHDKLYSFSFISAPYLPSCDALPLSEEQVYEYLISTVEFLE